MICIDRQSADETGTVLFGAETTFRLAPDIVVRSCIATRGFAFSMDHEMFVFPPAWRAISFFSEK